MTDPESPPTAVEATEDIYFNDFGDVILLVGKYRIHVASVILGTASVVFKAMFSPKFQEGYELHKAAEDRVTVISLPEDNAEAVLTLCRIVHFDNAVLNRCIPTLAALDDLVMVCDKYDCSQAVHFVSKDWMALYVHDAGLPGHENLLILSYLFNLPEAFCTISSTLFEKYNGPFEKIIMDRGRDVLPMRIWGKPISF